MNIKKTNIKIFIIVLFVMHFFSSFSFADGSSYCSTPPFITSSVKPNVLIMLDNSGSMKVSMYKDNPEYDNSKGYFGIFDNSSNYTYNPNIPVDTNGYYVSVDTSVKGAFVKSDCTVNGVNNCWSGNFLNFLTTKRIDATRMVLIGGKVEDRNGYDYLENGGKQYKIVGNNEPSDRDFDRKQGITPQTPFKNSNIVFKVTSPAKGGSTKDKYDPYAKIVIQNGLFLILDDDDNAIGEVGSVDSFNNDWKEIKFSREYNDPIVVIGALSENGGDPATIKIKDVTKVGFKIQIKEWRYLDGGHTDENTYYLVMEKGEYTIDGKTVYANSVTVPGNGGNTNTDYWEEVNFSEMNNPVVFATVASNNNDDEAVIVRLKDIESNSVKFKLYTEEKKPSINDSEKVGYIVFDEGNYVNELFSLDVSTKDISSSTKVDVSEFGDFIATLQTFNGSDPFYLRVKDDEMYIEEEKSKDSETDHTTETVGILNVKAKLKFNIAVVVNDEPKGIIQDMADKVRLGISFFIYTKDSDIYNGETSDGGILKLDIPKNPFVKDNDDIDNSGGYLQFNTYVGSDVGNITYSVEHYPLVWGTTPLAETLVVVDHYFEQDKNFSYYTNYNKLYEVNNTWDPYYYSEYNQEVRCAKSFVIVFTDGYPYTDEYIPEKYVDYDNDNNTEDGRSDNKTDNSYTDNLDDVAKYVYENDLRNDLNNKQNLIIYTVGFAGGEIRQILKDAADNGGGKAYAAADGYALEQEMKDIFIDILKQTSAGSSVSVLAKKTSKGSLLTQAVFYAEKTINNTKLDWVGQLFAYWFYNEKGVQNIREDSIKNHILDICSNGNPSGDNILEFDVDNSTGQLNIKKYGSTCDGTIDYDQESSADSLDDLADLCEVGSKLANISYDNRTIYTEDNDSLIPFNVARKDVIKKYLGNNTATPFPDNLTLSGLINYIRGLDFDNASIRNRSFYDNGTKKTWKLGDIIYSSPKVVDYDNYAMVFVGANDGMLHAFRLGHLTNGGLSNYQSTKICNSKDDCNTDKLGQEEWAFIPKNVLPYLKYLADPNYCHIYTVDLSPYIVYSIQTNNTVKKILIGGMRFGGGVTGCSSADGCINPPDDTCPVSDYDLDNGSCIGRSSYFALDVTDPTNPKFLWEFNKKYLGFSYSGPGVIKINGIYYIVFASGPTDYKGKSKQDLHLYVLKLKSDFTVDEVYDLSNELPSQLKNAFGSRIMTEGIDGNDDGNTDLLFFGVTHLSGQDSWKGNVLVIKTNNDEDPNNWTIEKVFNQGTSAITSSIEYMKCFNHHYIYFGTGRWFYREDDPGKNNNDKEYLYGVMIDGCFSGNCNIDSAKNTSDSCDEIDSNRSVWAYQIPLEAKNGDYYKERLISNPTVDPYDNLVFFSTTEPSSDICSFGGRSRMWGLNCATGLSMFDTSCPNHASNILSNTTYMQLSKGNIVQANKDSFNKNEDTTTDWNAGVTPETGPILPPPYTGVQSSILLWLER